jgi:hypothetical protein
VLIVIEEKDMSRFGEALSYRAVSSLRSPLSRTEDSSESSSLNTYDHISDHHHDSHSQTSDSIGH